MKYRDVYLSCKTLKELETMVMNDMKTAMWLNPDRISVIKEEAEHVANLKFKKEKANE